MKAQHTSALKRNPSEKVQNKADFTCRKLSVGIDVHKMRWQVAVYYEGLILSNVSIEGSSEALVTHLRKYYGDAILHVSMRAVLLAFRFVEVCGLQAWSVWWSIRLIYQVQIRKEEARPIK